jgi:hypothetical protein
MNMKTTEYLLVIFIQVAHELNALVTHALVSWRTEENSDLGRKQSTARDGVKKTVQMARWTRYPGNISVVYEKLNMH